MYAASIAASENTGSAATKIISYLRQTSTAEMVFRHDPNGINLHAYVDASYNRGVHGRSHFGFALFLNHTSAAFEVVSKRIVSIQPQSSCEAEYYALGEAAKSVIHRRNMLKELGFDITGPSIIYTDNQACIDIANKARYRKNCRHMAPRLHAIRYWIMTGEIKVCKVYGKLNCADVLTKELFGEDMHLHNAKLMGQYIDIKRAYNNYHN